MRAIILTTVLFLAAAFPILSQTVNQPGSPAERLQGEQLPGEENKEEQKHYFYQWTDSKGVVHIADELGKVPEKYRSRARKLESLPGEIDGQGGQIEKTPAIDFREREAEEQDQKEEWQRRMRVAKQQLADAEQHYRELGKRKEKLLEQWGGIAALESGHFEGREEADRIDQEMKEAQQEIDNARNEVEAVIPDEARKEGIPPGWLRE